VSTGQGGGVWTQQASKLVGTGAVGSPSKVSPARDRGHVIQKAAYSQNATGENNQIAEQCVEGSTIWWFAAFLFLLGFSTLDMIVKSTSGPATPPVPPAPSSSK
jgi:hypothetical protein